MKTLINFEDFWPEANRDVVIPGELALVPEVIQEIPKPKAKRRSRKEGLWFVSGSGKLLDTIPTRALGKNDLLFSIYYQGELIGEQFSDFILQIYAGTRDPYIIKLENPAFEHEPSYDDVFDFPKYKIGRLLTLDDFKIVENPSYRG
jgi:hypothetical protein